jgi:hypothetical protein
MRIADVRRIRAQESGFGERLAEGDVMSGKAKHVWDYNLSQEEFD